MIRNGDLIGNRIWKNLIPFAGIAVLESCFYIVDGVCAGYFLGNDALAVTQLSLPIVTFQQTFLAFFGQGSCAAAVWLLGKREKKKADAVITMAWISILVLSILSCLVGLFLSEPIVDGLVSGNQAVYPLAYDYMSIILIFSPVTICAGVLPIFLHYDNYSRLSFSYLLTANVMNYVLNYYVLNFTDWGITGVAAATMICSALSLPTLIIYLCSKNRIFHFTAVKNIRLKFYRYFFKYGLNAGITRLFICISAFTVNYLLMSFCGSQAIAVYGVFRNVNYIMSELLSCAWMTVTICAGMFYAEEDWYSLRFMIKRTATITVGMLAVAMLLLFLKADAFVWLFGAQEIADSVRVCLWGLAVCLPFSIANMLYSDYEQALGESKLPFVCGLSRNVLGKITFMALCVSLFGIHGIWIGILLAEASTCLLVHVYRKRLFKKGKLKYDGIFMIPPYVEYEDDKLNLSISATEEEAMNTARLAVMFCMEHHLPKYYCNMIGLASEELLVNIVSFGFNNQKKSVTSIDYLLALHEDKIILRIRDDGVLFNPAAYTSEEIDTGVGIKLVMGLAHSYAYSRLLDCNNSTIVLPRLDNLSVQRIIAMEEDELWEIASEARFATRNDAQQYAAEHHARAKRFWERLLIPVDCASNDHTAVVVNKYLGAYFHSFLSEINAAGLGAFALSSSPQDETDIPGLCLTLVFDAALSAEKTQTFQTILTKYNMKSQNEGGNTYRVGHAQVLTLSPLPSLP